LGPSFRKWGVTLVHECRDEAELQGCSERRRELGIYLHDTHPSGRDVAHQLDQPRHVEYVLEALSHRLQHNREAFVTTCHLEEKGALLALLPQGGAAPRPPARKKQRP
jgi:hypothetical protein